MVERGTGGEDCGQRAAGVVLTSPLYNYIVIYC